MDLETKRTICRKYKHSENSIDKNKLAQGYGLAYKTTSDTISQADEIEAYLEEFSYAAEEK